MAFALPFGGGSVYVFKINVRPSSYEQWTGKCWPTSVKCVVPTGQLILHYLLNEAIILNRKWFYFIIHI